MNEVSLDPRKVAIAIVHYDELSDTSIDRQTISRDMPTEVLETLVAELCTQVDLAQSQKPHSVTRTDEFCKVFEVHSGKPSAESNQFEWVCIARIRFLTEDDAAKCYLAAIKQMIFAYSGVGPSSEE